MKASFLAPLALFALLAAPLPISAGPPTGAELDLDSYGGDIGAQVFTPWGSPVDGSVDLGWEGTWTLESASLVAPQGEIRWPTAGHTLSINQSGAFRLDYGSAQFLPAIETAAGGSVPVTLPPGLAPPGFAGGCAQAGTISGLAVGSLTAAWDAEQVTYLDTYNPESESPGAVEIYPWMEARLDKAASVKPTLSCAAGTSPVTTSAALPALGLGRPAATAHGPAVVYEYEISPDLSRLTITGRDQPGFVYRFIRVN